VEPDGTPRRIIASAIAESRGERAAPHVAHLPAGVVDQHRLLWWRLALPAQETAQMLVHVPAEVHARHHFLADVAALGVRDRV
jgi:hypothetical protein